MYLMRTPTTLQFYDPPLPRHSNKTLLLNVKSPPQKKL